MGCQSIRVPLADCEHKLAGALDKREITRLNRKINEDFTVVVLLEGFVNNEEEKAKLTAELQRLEGFLGGVRKKLSNEKFVNGAPQQVVALERKKEADALAKIEAIKEALAKL